MAFPEMSAFLDECAVTLDTLQQVPADAWDRPALGEWNLAQLTAHLTRATTRVPEYLPLPVADAPLLDRVEYFGTYLRRIGLADSDVSAPSIAQRSVDDATGVDPTTWPQRFADGARATVKACASHPADHVLQTFVGPMRLDEYVATRVLEVVVHHMDVRAALDLPPVATPPAARITMEILEGLLGEPRPRNLGRTRFILAATGRTPSDDPRFPVLH
jgi:uncharacterized protein (TIGR03083 family)